MATDRVVDEMIMSFTHEISMPADLPKVAPTGRRVMLPVVVVMGIQNGKVAYERIYWDQASLLAQIGGLSAECAPSDATRRNSVEKFTLKTAVEPSGRLST